MDLFRGFSQLITSELRFDIYLGSDKHFAVWAQHIDELALVFQRKAKSWDAYQQAYTKIANEALEDFFGESFVRAYEEQIKKLR